MIITIMKTIFQKLKSKLIYYRDYSMFSNDKFREELWSGLPADLENLEKPEISLCDLGSLENQGKFLENLENIFLTWNFPFNQNLKIKIVSFN